MTIAVIIALVSLLLSVLLGFMRTMRVLGRIEQRIDLLWSWYLAEVGPGIPGGRRRTDPPAPWSARGLEQPRDEAP